MSSGVMDGVQPRTPALIQGGLYLLVASIPFEYPERSIPLEIPTLTGAVFLAATLLYPRKSYGRLPAPALWFGAYLVAYLLAAVVGSGEHFGEALSEWIIVLQGVLVLLAAANLMRDDTVATRGLLILVAACGVRAALPLVGLGRTTDAVWTGGERISALGQNANSAAMILAAGLVALVGLMLARRRRSLARLGLAGALAMLMGFAVVETGSRGGFLALVGGLTIYALAADTWRRRLRNGLIAALAVSLLAFATLRIPMMKNRLAESLTTGNMAGRERLYPALWGMFLQRPVLGWGPVTNTYELARRIGERERSSRAAHNILLEVLTATGLVGAIPLLAGVGLSLRSAWRARRGEHGVLPLALLATLFLANMSGDWLGSKLLWLVLAYAIASGGWRLLARRAPTRRRQMAGVPALAGGR